jgi:hypothetical protein
VSEVEAIYRFALYFVLGGCTTLAASYLNESGKGGAAAMVASLPVFFVLTALIAYYASGPQTAIDYSKGMVLANVPWLVAVVMFGFGIHQGYHPLITAAFAVILYLLIMAATAGLV